MFFEIFKSHNLTNIKEKIARFFYTWFKWVSKWYDEADEDLSNFFCFFFVWQWKPPWPHPVSEDKYPLSEDKYPKSDMQLDRVVSIFSSLVANQEVLPLFFYLQSIVAKTAHHKLRHAASTRGQIPPWSTFRLMDSLVPHGRKIVNSKQYSSTLTVWA